jgi:phospholipid transport system substrate-binding protein
MLVLAASQAWAGGPTAELRRSIDAVLTILKNPGFERKPVERRAALRRAIRPAFDFPEVARRVLGRHWHERTAEERARFVALFGELLDATYLSRIEAYAGERIVYVGESVDGDHATVRTRIVTQKGTEVPVDYRMLRRDDHWAVYDVIIEDVSLVENYRSQFNDIIETSSYPTLVERIRAKVQGETARAKTG